MPCHCPGVANAGDLRDYFRLSPQQASPRLQELVEMGTLRVIKVEGWANPGYLHRDASLPRKLRGQALLATRGNLAAALARQAA